MKKTTLLAVAAALISTGAMAQEAQEVQYTTDPAQGYLFNRMQDNWFITAEGGANIQLGVNDRERKFGDRFAPQASIYVGKWFTPVFGARIGGEWLQLKGLSLNPQGTGVLLDEPMVKGEYYKTKENGFGPMADLMVNLTNWWCGYHPGRVYECIVYGGAGGYFTYAKSYDRNGKDEGWKYAHDAILTVRAGLINQFNLSKHFSIGLDLRYAAIADNADLQKNTTHDISANLAFTYRFNNTDWNAPVVPVVTPGENCDAYRARLQAADARIADLEAQLRDCLNRPATVKEVKSDAPLATIYFPISVSTLTKTDRNVLKAVAGVMTSHPDKKYTVTGWADNYTGNDAINTRLRKARAASVEAQLKKNGVPASQLDVTTNNGNLCDLGDKYVALDRAVTINEK